MIEYCGRCGKDTPHRQKYHCYRDGKNGYKGFSQPLRCLTCGFRPEKASKTKSVKHISLR